jgi:hypothetical protein
VEKKHHKTFAQWHTRPISKRPRVPTDKSFLVLFFKKELLPGCAVLADPIPMWAGG